MRVAVVAPDAPGAMGWYLARALRDAGHEVETMDQRWLAHGRLPGIANRLAWRTALVPRALAGRVQREVLALSRRAELVITVKGEHLEPETVARIATERPIVNWYADTPVFDGVFDRIEPYTWFCPKDAWTVARLQEMGFADVRHLPHASAPDVLSEGGFVPPSRRRPRFDVVVLGSMYPYREHQLRRLVDAGLSVAVWGGRPSPSLRGRLASWTVDQAVCGAMGAAFRDGRVALNTVHPQDVDGANQRLLDIAASCSLQVTEARPGSVELLGVEGVAPHGPGEDFVEVVRAAVAGWDDEERIAAAYERVRAAHTYAHRVETLLGWVADYS